VIPRTDTREVSLDIRQPLVTAPYELLLSTNSTVDQGFVDKHQHINPASVELLDCQKTSPPIFGEGF